MMTANVTMNVPTIFDFGKKNKPMIVSITPTDQNAISPFIILTIDGSVSLYFLIRLIVIFIVFIC